jgi:hypothetical protein
MFGMNLLDSLRCEREESLELLSDDRGMALILKGSKVKIQQLKNIPS